MLYATSVRRCGRLIVLDGINFDPRRFDGIRIMACPSTGSELQQFICAIQWMRSGISKFLTIIGAFAIGMERVYAVARKRIRRAVAKVFLESVGWSNTQHT